MLFLLMLLYYLLLLQFSFVRVDADQLFQFPSFVVFIPFCRSVPGSLTNYLLSFKVPCRHSHPCIAIIRLFYLPPFATPCLESISHRSSRTTSFLFTVFTFITHQRQCDRCLLRTEEQQRRRAGAKTCGNRYWK
jgi:hypothetical protein